MEKILIHFPMILVSLCHLSTTWNFKLHWKKSSISRFNLAPCINTSKGESRLYVLSPLSESGIFENAVLTDVSAVMQLQALSFS